MRIFLAILCAIFAAWAIAQSPARTFTFLSQTSDCNGGDQLMMLAPGQWSAPPAVPGAGVMPPSFSIRQVCVSHMIVGDTTDSYVVAGKSGVNGDHLTPMMPFQGFVCMGFSPANPFVVGEYLDVHARCTGVRHWVTMTVQYTQP
jgi:hypothetical protein